MSLLLAQLLLLCGLVAFLSAPVALVVFGCRLALRGKSRRSFLVTAFFTTGALAGGFVAWKLVPSKWTLPFWTTLKATVDTATYGHEVEHYAEGVVIMLTLFALVGGSIGGAAAAFCTRRRRLPAIH